MHGKCSLLVSVALCMLLRKGGADTCATQANKQSTIVQLLANYNATCATKAHSKTISGNTLAYVTPWNGRGYDNAKHFTGKFSFVSPVWLQARDSSRHDIEISGQHDIDQGWMKDVRTAGGCSNPTGEARIAEDGTALAGTITCPKIVPRVAWELRTALTPALVKRTVTAITDVCVKHGFDGIVLECSVADSFHPLIRALAQSLHARIGPTGVPLVLIQVLPPNGVTSGQVVSGLRPAQFKELAEHVDAFSLMTYDYSVHRGRPDGPNAPLPWVREAATSLLPAEGEASRGERAALAAKILIGLPFYGYDSGEAILGGKFLDIMRDNPDNKLKFEVKSVEHVFSYTEGGGKRRTVHYPTPYFIAMRVELARELGMGISVWEIGQGLPYLFDQI